MGLKAFHVFFIVASTLLCVGFGLWAVAAYLAQGRAGWLVLGVASFIGAAVLVCYGLWFLRKLKDVSYQ